MWADIIARSPELWAESRRRAATGPDWLVATSVGGHAAVTVVESLLGVALTLRGANVRFLLCDGALTGCMKVHTGLLKSPEVITGQRLPKEVCPGCIGRGRPIYESTGLPVDYYNELLGEDERARLRRVAASVPLGAIATFQENGVAVGEHALAGALRFFSRGTLEGESAAEGVLREYFYSALVTAAVMRSFLRKHPVAGAVFHHGIYVPQGLIGEALRAERRRVVNWQVAYRKQCFIFSHHETYHHALLTEPARLWEDIPWTDRLNEQTMRYLQSRWHGTEDWIWFHDTPQHDIKAIRQELQLDPNRPVVSLLTNVFWDAQLHYRANAYPNMLAWIVDSIEYFAKRPDLQLVIRIHPAEIRGSIKSRQPLTAEIAQRFPVLPENIRVVAPESQVSTYALCEASDSVVIYGTKTGVEMAAMGIPVIVAGEAWIRNKGMTSDASSPDEYRQILDRLPLKQRLDDDTTRRARRYAFHFFFRRFVPLGFVEPATGAAAPFVLNIEKLEDLLPGRDPGLDVLCDGILQGKEFIYPAERYLN